MIQRLWDVSISHCYTPLLAKMDLESSLKSCGRILIFSYSSSIMCSLLVLGLMLILPSIVSAVDLDSATSLDDALITSDPMPLDLLALSSDQPVFSPLDQIASPPLFDAGNSNTDASESLPWSEGGNQLENDASSILSPPLDGTILADTPPLADSPPMANPPQMADCSATSEFLPALGKSRVRRLDDARLCPLPANSGAAKDGFPDLPGLRKLRLMPGWDEKVEKASEDEDHNMICSVYFYGYFPWGLCSSGWADDITLMGGPVLNLGLFGPLDVYTVSRGMLSTFDGTKPLSLFLSLAPPLSHTHTFSV